MQLCRLPILLPISLLSLCAGCLPQLPENAKPSDSPQRSILANVPDGKVEAEDGVNDAVWLEVNRPGGDTIGGYYSLNESPSKSIVIILHGASTFSIDGEVGSAHMFHKTFGTALQNRGYITWSLVYPECGTPYGQDDLQAVLDAVDWIRRVGRDTLDLQQVYIAGYSTGGTLSILASRQRSFSAVCSVSGLTEPRSLEEGWALFNFLAGAYPLNLGICQMGETLQFYGPPGSSGWDMLDSVAHFDELHSPMLIMHGTDDPIFSTSNAQDLENRYQVALQAGVSVPEMKFTYLDGVSHFPDLTSPDLLDEVVSFFDAHRLPAAP